jgi:hypothetical protein
LNYGIGGTTLADPADITLHDLARGTPKICTTSFKKFTAWIICKASRACLEHKACPIAICAPTKASPLKGRS